MSTKASLIPLLQTSLLASSFDIDALQPGQFIEDSHWIAGPDLGGQPLRLFCLKPGLLSDIGYYENGTGIYRETTRYGFMQEPWPGEDWVNKRIDALKLGRPIHTTVDRAILVGTDWDNNYQHFLIETFPRVYYLQHELKINSSIPIVVSDFPHVREILGTCFPSGNFIYLPNMSALVIKGFGYFISPNTKNVGDQSRLLHTALKFWRNRVLDASKQISTYPNNQDAKVFFGRRQQRGYSGNTRVMVNYGEFELIVRGRSYDVRYFDGLSNVDKACILRDVRIAVMPIGANLMNMLFSVGNVSLGIISHPVFQPNDWFSSLLKGVEAPVDVIKYFTKTSVEGSEMCANSPYRVDEKEIDHFLSTLESSV